MLSFGDLILYAGLVIALHDVQRSDDAKVERRFRDHSQSKNRVVVSVPRLRGDTVTVEQSGVIEMSHSSLRGILIQRSTSAGSALLSGTDDPVLQTEAVNQFRPDARSSHSVRENRCRYTRADSRP